MLFGIGVLGVVTAGFASWLVERVDDLDEIEHGVTPPRADVEALRAEVVRLREALERAVARGLRGPLAEHVLDQPGQRLLARRERVQRGAATRAADPPLHPRVREQMSCPNEAP